MPTEPAAIDDAAPAAPERSKRDALRLMVFGMVVGLVWAIGWGVAATLNDSGLWLGMAAWGLVTAGWGAARFVWISRHWSPTEEEPRCLEAD